MAVAVKSLGVKEHIRDVIKEAGKLISPTSTKYKIHVVTGDRRGAGTDANVYLILRGPNNEASDIIRPNSIFANDHEKGSTTTVDIDDIGIDPPFASIEVWRDNFGNVPSVLGKITEHFYGGSDKSGSAAWYLDRIEIEVLDPDDRKYRRKRKMLKNLLGKRTPVPFDASSRSSSESSICGKSERYVFPVQRWIEAGKSYKVEQYDCILPTDEPRPDIRKNELIRKKIEYQFTQNTPGGPAQIAKLPSDEQFSDEYFWTFASDKLKFLAKTKVAEWTTKRWQSMDEFRKMVKKSLGEPELVGYWKEDWWFGLQRLQGVNPMLIQACPEIPDKLGVTQETVAGLLEDLTLDEALSKNRIFKCDLEILDEVSCKDERELAAPIALFYLTKKDELLPIAIQLKQQKGSDNPIFTPKDSPNTWLVAKMYYNNAEAQHHQAVSHLGLTHLLMEGVCICTHRNLSPSHPMFKLMAPHFLFLLAINWRGLEKLISPGGWVDGCMTQGVQGIFQVIIRGFERYNMTKYGDVNEECKARGVLDPNILPYYPYRDDAISLFSIIQDYVSRIVRRYYDTDEKLRNDWELKEWRQELSRSRERGGVGLDGVPGDDIQGFSTVDEVVHTISIIIATCSLGHAAANFQQYEQYAFVPNYAGILNGPPPKEKVQYTETDILELLPNKRKTLDIMVITKLLSSRGTNKLGDFEMQYMYDPADVQAADEFRKELRKLSLEIQKRNIDRRLPFPYLDPDIVPNAISI